MALSSDLVENWTLFSIASMFVFIRVLLRTNQLGFKGWKGDDYLVLVAYIAFTYDVASVDIIDRYGCNVGLTEDVAANLSPEEARRLKIGSIADFFSWLAWVTLLWSCKGCMLFLFSRITMGLWQRQLVMVAAWIVGVTYIGGVLTNIFKCGTNVKRNWQIVPAPGSCTSGTANLFFVGITNFLTDAFILSIPPPLLWKSRLPTKKKFFIFFMLCSGVFIVVVSALRCIYSILTVYNDISVTVALAWSTRENFTAMIIVNIPIIVSSVQALRSGSKSNSSSLLGTPLGILSSRPWKRKGGGNGTSTNHSVLSADARRLIGRGFHGGASTIDNETREKIKTPAEAECVHIGGTATGKGEPENVVVRSMSNGSGRSETDIV